MSTYEEAIANRFSELQQQMDALARKPAGGGYSFYPLEDWHAWAVSVLNLLDSAFGRDSAHYQTFTFLHQRSRGDADVNSAKGVFRAAKADYDRGYVFRLQRQIAGEVLGDFVGLSKQAMANGSHQVAAVLACAALEDALKRYAASQGLDVGDKVMQQVVAALKTKGLVTGASKSLLDSMPKVRDYAMHANWEKITPADTTAVIGFVEQFLLTHFG